MCSDLKCLKKYTRVFGRISLHDLSSLNIFSLLRVAIRPFVRLSDGLVFFVLENNRQ